MAVRPSVKVTVHSVLKGECPAGFKVGDSWIIDSGKTPGGMCASAYYSVFCVSYCKGFALWWRDSLG